MLRKTCLRSTFEESAHDTQAREPPSRTWELEAGDFSISKHFPVGAARLEFPGEIFNLLNTTNFGQPDGNVNNVTAGVISTADDARNMQFGIRFAW